MNLQHFPKSYFKIAFHLHVNYTLCSPSSRLLWEGKVKEDDGKVLERELCGCSYPLWYCSRYNKVAKLSWWAEACEHLLIPFPQLTFASKQDCEGMLNGSQPSAKPDPRAWAMGMASLSSPYTPRSELYALPLRLLDLLPPNQPCSAWLSFL